MSARNLKSPSPLRLNSPESYETAAKEIELEKQMVAALKRLSMGHLMNRDPDLPPDDECLFVHDRDRHDDSTVSETLSPSNSPSPQTSGSQTPPLVSSITPEYKIETATNQKSPDSDPEATENTHLDDLDAESLFWVPANLHPEVNPLQFKKHVRSTIDELLERKLSRSKSTASKRSSLSLSITDQLQLQQLQHENEKKAQEEEKSRNRFSNPSLRELSTELEALSKLAGMDSNDAVSVARSLSTSSLGYTDVEKMAFDELGSPSHTSPSANQAELLDFGVEETSPTAHKTYAMLNRMMGQPHPYQGPSRKPHRPQTPSDSPFGSPLLSRQRQTPEDFALKRSRRLDYRKAHSTSSTQLGSQLQSHKAEKLAELRHNLSGSSMPLFDSSSNDHLNPNKTSVRLSMQSINPRSSQMLFSYRNPSKAPPVVSTTPPQSISPSPPGSAPRDVSYGSHGAQLSVGQHVHHTKYGLQNATSKHLAHPHQALSLRGHRNPLREHELRKTSGSHPPEHQRYQPSRSSSGGPTQPKQRQVSPFGPLQGQQVKAQPYRKQYPHLQQFHGAQQPLQQQPHSGNQKTPVGSQPKQNGQRPIFPQRAHSAPSQAEVGVPHTQPSHEYSKRDKSRQLNQNLDLLRDEINQFKESLSRDPKTDVVQESVSTKNEPDISFDISSHDVSYEDSLGIEQEVLKELNTEKPRSPKTSPKKERAVCKENFEVVTELEYERKPKPAVSSSSIQKKFGPELEEVKPKGPISSKPPMQRQLSSTNVVGESLDYEASVPVKVAPSEVAAYPEVWVGEHKEERSVASLKQEYQGPKKTKSFGSLAKTGPEKKKKTWLWSKDRSVSANPVTTATSNTKAPSRSISSPEISSARKDLPKEKAELPGKENVITKLFKKKRSNSVSSETYEQSRKSSTDSAPSVEYEAADSRGKRRVSTAFFKMKEEEKGLSLQRSRDTDEEPTKQTELKSRKLIANKPEEETVKSRIKNKLKNIAKGLEDKTEAEPAKDTQAEEENRQSSLEVQEKLKKSIRRTSRANQPIVFTDSAFGFPLPPPSHSTLVMLDYRFPVHVERAIYRLSHLKLANPKRSLREQVLLSNFMYAYLNLVDHTLHLEQQMSTDEPGFDQPEADMEMFNSEDADTEFEADEDELDDGAFDTIHLDLDHEHQITA